MRPRIGILASALVTVACVSTGASNIERHADLSSAVPARGQLERREGLMNLYLDEEAGKVWLEVPEANARFLYVEGLAGGLGSNPVGLDRGELGSSRVVSMRRMGDRLLIIEPNLRYRAVSGSLEEKRAVGESFATSVIWAGEVDSERRPGLDLIDLTPFLVRDAHDAASRLEKSGQGKFQLDLQRSVVDLDSCLAFPDNLEFEALLTFAGSEPGPLVRETTPTPKSVTLIQHHSLIRLPDSGYQPRAFDPRAGSFAIEFADYSAALDDSIERRWIVRHRLQKVSPGAERSAPVEPIVYYVDPAIPEPIRGAVFDGVGWWARAFEAAGFEDAFRVELLPAGAHPLDARYNVVEWVHRSTRGWSYGGGIVDPRTGEMLKGHVRLGSLRVRQDRLLFEGLAGTGKTGSGEPDDPVQLALARIRQLAAHEVGHTLGLAHNFAASTYEGRASVMDYPAPLVQVTADGKLDFSEAYGVGVGSWDLHAVRYAYAEFPPESDESVELEELVRDGLERGLVFLTDQDARSAGAAQPLASLWDNGRDPVAQLELEMRVRRLALERFGEENLRPGRPLSLLEEVLVPLYLHHRYQLTAALKVLGGVDYRYAVRGDDQPPARPVAAEEQRRALAAVLGTLEPAVLDLPDRVLELLLPRPAGFRRNREQFRGATAPVFDPLAAAGAAADATVRGLLQPERAARMVDLHRRDSAQPDFTEVLTALLDTVFAAPSEGLRQRAIRERIQSVVVQRLIELALDPGASPAVRARAEWGLTELLQRLELASVETPVESAHTEHLTRLVRRHLERVGTAEGEPSAAPALPPGDPIGAPVPVPGWSQCSW